MDTVCMFEINVGNLQLLVMPNDMAGKAFFETLDINKQKNVTLEEKI